MRINVFVVDDHEIMRGMLVEYLESESDFEVCGTAESGEEALKRIGEASPDIALIDLALPGMNGIDLVKNIHDYWPQIPCLMYSAHGERSYVDRSLAAGACGYMVKGNPDELPGAIRTIMNGETYISESAREETGERP